MSSTGEGTGISASSSLSSNNGMAAGDRVFELILGPESIRDLRGFCLFIVRLLSTIGKRIRSNTLSPASYLLFYIFSGLVLIHVTADLSAC